MWFLSYSKRVLCSLILQSDFPLSLFSCSGLFCCSYYIRTAVCILIVFCASCSWIKMWSLSYCSHAIPDNLLLCSLLWWSWPNSKTVNKTQMLSFIRVSMVMVSLHSTKILRQKLVPEMGYCSNRADHAFCWQKIDFGSRARKAVGLNGLYW